MTERDSRIVEREIRLILDSSKNIIESTLYSQLLGIFPDKDRAYLGAYNSLLDIDPSLAELVAEVYLLRHIKAPFLLDDLNSKKEKAKDNEDYDSAAQFRYRANMIGERFANGIENTVLNAINEIKRLDADLSKE